MPDERRLRVATFNIESFGGGTDDDARAAVMAPILSALRADILCLQEVNRGPPKGRVSEDLAAIKALCGASGYGDFHLVSTLRNGRRPYDIHNLVVFSRWPVAERVQVLHELVPRLRYQPVTAEPPATTSDEISWDRPLLHLVIDHPDFGRLHVINLHLRAPLAAPIAGQKTGPFTWKTLSGWAEGFFVATAKRSGQALEVRLLLERIFDREPAPNIVVCGDFNATGMEMPLKIIRGELEDIDEPALEARQLVTAEDRVPEATRYSLLHAGERLMLDHVLVSRALAPRIAGAEVHSAGLPDEQSMAADDPRPHHAPVVVEFKLAEA